MKCKVCSKVCCNVCSSKRAIKGSRKSSTHTSRRLLTRLGAAFQCDIETGPTCEISSSLLLPSSRSRSGAATERKGDPRREQGANDRRLRARAAAVKRSRERERERRGFKDACTTTADIVTVGVSPLCESGRCCVASFSSVLRRPSARQSKQCKASPCSTSCRRRHLRFIKCLTHTLHSRELMVMAARCCCPAFASRRCRQSPEGTRETL